MKYVILGNPIPLARHRHAERRTWDSQKQEKLIWGLNIRQQHFAVHGDMKYAGPIHVDVVFYMALPRTSKARQNKMIDQYHLTRPDVDNLLKWVCDAVTGVLWEDDCIVSSVFARKQYDTVPRTEFTICELTNE